jgi:hypothetical protein
MAVYVRFNATPALDGPLDLGPSVTAPTGQPNGFSVTNVFDGQGRYFIGASAPSSLFAGTGSQTSAGSPYRTRSRSR